jgi:UDP-N-acetyl-D-mannosaminuronic acid dehydrogenase
MQINVLGLGYVGLTLALTLANVGFKIIGIDKDKEKIAKLQQGIPTLYEPQIEQLLKSVLLSGNISFAEDIQKIEEQVVYIISVGTPIDNQTQEPNLTNLKNVVKEVGESIKKDDMVIVRSTVPVKTARNIIKPELENISNLKCPSDFYLATAPERTLQGAALKELRQLSQIIGGINEESVEKAASIFNKTTKTIVKVSSLEAAELIKLLDNTYRDITISVGNMCGKICKELDLDAREVIESANYGYSRNKILLPGAGVGGGCLVKDPYLLIASLKGKLELELVKSSRRINDSMIDETIKLIKNGFKKVGREIENSKILILGFAFKGVPDTDDIRFSPTLPIVDFLKEQKSMLFGFDPVVPSKTIKELGVKGVPDFETGEYDCVIIMNNNPKFRNIDFKKIEDKTKMPILVIDGWYLYDKKYLDTIGIKYFPIGSKQDD